VLDLRPTPFDHPDAVLLTEEVQQYYTRVYGGTDGTSVDPLEFVAPHGLFLVGYVGAEPVACGGWRRRGDDGDPDAVLLPGDAEIKRMYVREAHRGRGHARALLAELERTAAAAGRRRAVLETGVPQAAAIALYVSAGYEPAAAFGDYRESPDSRHYAKLLTSAGPHTVEVESGATGASSGG
jgi:ribosomal protein S18 acetylase RimI-like enzyme